MINRLKELCPNLIISEDVNMGEHTTFKCGGNAKYLIEVGTIEELRDVIKFFNSESFPYMFIGNGSNILFSDNGYNGAIIKLKKDSIFSQIVFDDEIVTCGAAVLMSSLAKALLNEGLTGFEQLSGIPGSIGGAVYMNAGAYEKSISDVILSCIAMDKEGNLKEFTLSEMGLSYRNSNFMENGYIVLSAVFKFAYGNKDEILEKMKDYANRRNTKQPVKYPSAGSTFKRPTGYFAGKLIEDSNLKGFSIGGAMVSTLHAGFVINYNNATATDVINLIKYIQDKVYVDSGIMLEPEVRII